jgi:hypothetical protein
MGKKTGFTYPDELSKEERKQVFKNVREYLLSQTPEERKHDLMFITLLFT